MPIIGINSLTYLLNIPFIKESGLLLLKKPKVKTNPLRTKNIDTQKAPSNKNLK